MIGELQRKILECLAEDKNQSLGSIGLKLDKARSTIQTMVDRMVRNGLIRKTPLKARSMRLTKKGRATL